MSVHACIRVHVCARMLCMCVGVCSCKKGLGVCQRAWVYVCVRVLIDMRFDGCFIALRSIDLIESAADMRFNSCFIAVRSIDINGLLPVCCGVQMNMNIIAVWCFWIPMH